MVKLQIIRRGRTILYGFSRYKGVVIVHHVRLFYDGVTMHWSVNGNVSTNVSAGEIQNGVMNKGKIQRINVFFTYVLQL